ncbi:MAG: HAD family hydrolase [Chloroflexota bacterium]|nr:HAD family hydrolase [Chloroflexota bacterium]
MIIFDLDGTLYEDLALYDRYADELARFLPDSDRSAYFAAWESAKRGEGLVRIGLGYEDETDRLFRYAGGWITTYLDWEGGEEPVSANGAERPNHTLFVTGRLNIGDWWGIPQAIAAHHGVGPVDRAAAFHATRDHMATDTWHIQPEPGLPEVLDALHAAGETLVAMTNSPDITTEDVLRRLGLRHRFGLVVSGAQKPAGMARFLETAGPPENILSIGDHYVNDIEPALEAGASALYVDRHATNLGAGHPRLHRVSSIAEVPAWLEREYLC